MLDASLSSGLKSPPFIASYIEHRVNKEPEDGNPALTCLRRVAQKLAGDPHTLQHYVASLCVLAAPNAEQLFTTHHRPWKPIDDEEFQKHVQTAAVHLNKDAEIDVRRTTDTSSRFFGVCSNLAARSSSKALFELYLNSRFPTNRSSYLPRAAYAGRADLVRFIFNYQADLVPWRFDLNARRGREFLQLAKSLRTPDPEIWEFIMEIHRRYGIEVTPSIHISMLRNCAENGWVNMAQHLLEYGTDPNIFSDYYKHPAIVVAAKKGHIDVVKTLLRWGAKPTNSALRAAALHGHSEIVQSLLVHNCDVTGALVDSAKGGHFAVVKTLLDGGADVNEDDGEMSVICYSILKEHIAMFKYLVEQGAKAPPLAMRVSCSNKAKEIGVESMLEFFKSWCSTQIG